MYRGLVDSAVLNDPVRGFVGATGLSTAQFAAPDKLKGNICNSGDTGLDTFPSSPQRILGMKTQDEESSGSETAP